MSAKQKRPVPYDMVSPGFEAAYTGERASISEEHLKPDPTLSVDAEGAVSQKWSPWTWTWPGTEYTQEIVWDEQIKLINDMQRRLGPLSDDIRQTRSHIGSLVPCDIGFPVTVDELLAAIAKGRLDTPSFKNGCWYGGMWWDTKTTQPRHVESMATIERILRDYLNGASRESLVGELPHAEGFIRRAFEWLGPASDLSSLQRLLIEHVLLPFEYLSKCSCTAQPAQPEEATRLFQRVHENIFRPGGRGSAIFKEVSAIAGLPALEEELLDTIEDEQTRELCKLYWYRMSDAFYGSLTDCHHNCFRWIENWIHCIGTAAARIPTRREGAECERIGRLLFGYVLGLDKWLMGRPMQFLILDLGHVDLGFDPKNEILRVYAHLGADKTPVKEWLAACLWHNLTYNPIGGNPAGLVRHEYLLDRAGQLGINTSEWMDSQLRKDR